MSWHKKLFENKEINSSEYQNVIREISSQYQQYPEKRDKFAVFKEEIEDNNHLLYFSPTSDPIFTSIILNDLKADKCDKPNLNSAKLFLGKYI